MPLVNVGAAACSGARDYCRRANERGVDLNRNWPTGGWGQVWEGHRSGEVWEGPEPLSEPETRLVAAFARRWRPHVFLSLHSGQDALLAPHAHTMEVPRNHAQQVAALHEVNRRARVVQRARRAAFTHTGYACAGTSLDWFNDALNVSWSFAFEMGTWPARHAARSSRRPRTGRWRCSSFLAPRSPTRSGAAPALQPDDGAGVREGGGRGPPPPSPCATWSPRRSRRASRCS